MKRRRRPSLEFDTEDDVNAMHAPLVLSTFVPLLHQNVFQPTVEDAERLNLENSTPFVIYLLKPGETASFAGVFSLTILHGCLSLFGSLLKESNHAHRVFAPRSYPIATLQSIGSQSSPTLALPAAVKRAFSPGDVLVVIQELTTGVEGLGKICKIFDGMFESDSGQESFLGLQGISLVQYATNGWSPFILLPTWKAAFDFVHSSNPDVPLILVKGPKKSGKSMFGRMLLNQLTTRYERVAFLECDIGQSEFFPAGMVTLHVLSHPVFGPPFTHLAKPYRAHFLGCSSPKSNPQHYLACISALIQAYKLDIQFTFQTDDDAPREPDGRVANVVPIIVNTSGWVKGLGAELTQKIEELLEPTHVFEFDSTGLDPFRGTSHIQGKSKHCLVEKLPSTSIPTRYSPSDHRALSILSYFHARFMPDVDIVQEWLTELPLCAMTPWEVDWTLALDDIFLEGAGAEDVVPSEIHRVINGAVVGLLCVDDVPPSTPRPSPNLPYTQGAPPPPPQSSRCLGLALIRSLNTSSKTIQVLTPLSPTLFSQVRILVKGEIELPLWGMLDHRSRGDIKAGLCGVESTQVPFLQWTSRSQRKEPKGSNKKHVRRNLMRKGQM